MINFNGAIEREWILDYTVRYMKVIEGSPRKEGMIVGV